MGFIDTKNLPWVINNDISFFVSNTDRLQQAITTAKQLKRPARIHIEIETGLHRTGIEKTQLPHTIQLIKKNAQFLQLDGLCTHYAGAESISNYVRIHNQLQTFNDIKQWFNKKNIDFTYCHTACSAAALIYPETRMDMVRIGLAQYGYWPSKEIKIHKLESTMAKVQIISPDDMPNDKIYILTKVKIKNLSNDLILDYQLVSPEEADFEKKKISVTSPIGKALLGKVPGDIAVMNAPAGKIEYEILEISK